MLKVNIKVKVMFTIDSTKIETNLDFSSIANLFLITDMVKLVKPNARKV